MMSMTWEHFLLSLIWEASFAANTQHRVEFWEERQALSRELANLETEWYTGLIRYLEF